MLAQSGGPSLRSVPEVGAEETCRDGCYPELQTQRPFDL